MPISHKLEKFTTPSKEFINNLKLFLPYGLSVKIFTISKLDPEDLTFTYGIENELIYIADPKNMNKEDVNDHKRAYLGYELTYNQLVSLVNNHTGEQITHNDLINAMSKSKIDNQRAMLYYYDHFARSKITHENKLSLKTIKELKELSQFCTDNTNLVYFNYIYLVNETHDDFLGFYYAKKETYDHTIGKTYGYAMNEWFISRKPIDQLMFNNETNNTSMINSVFFENIDDIDFKETVDIFSSGYQRKSRLFCKLNSGHEYGIDINNFAVAKGYFARSTMVEYLVHGMWLMNHAQDNNYNKTIDVISKHEVDKYIFPEKTLEMINSVCTDATIIQIRKNLQIYIQANNGMEFTAFCERKH